MLVLLLAFGIVAIAIPLLARGIGTRIFYLAAIVPAAAFALTVAAGPKVLSGAPLAESYPWIPALHVTLAVRMDVLSWILSLIVTGIGALVLVYCAGYFSRTDPTVGRFCGILLAFAGAMWGLVIADDVYLLYVFWEATSVFSYLLIGHYSDRRASRGAALQALLVTTAGGLAMLVGLVIISVAADSTLLSDILAHPPQGTLVAVAVFLILVGALTKSALIPFHFWLPAAMAAPTPVSAYLHAAAMVKAGIYLIAALVPAFALIPGFRPTLVFLGVATMLIGGLHALKQHDLKLLLAYGTVSQLGFLTILLGFGDRDVALAGIAMLLAHALFKSTLFLVVGIIDRRAGTRDLRKLSGLWRTHPLLFVVGCVAVASMVGVPPTLGFVAKEAAFTSLIGVLGPHPVIGGLALGGIIAGSILTGAYSARFLWGAFAGKPHVPTTDAAGAGAAMLVPPALTAACGLALGIAAPLVDTWASGYAGSAPQATGHPDHLALWHGFGPALGISAFTLAAALFIFWQRQRVQRAQAAVPIPADAGHAYWATMRFVDRIAVRATSASQRGSLPIYLGVALVVLVGTDLAAVTANRVWPDGIRLWDHPAQVPIAVVMLVCAIAATRAKKRMTAMVLLGITGYGLAVLFVLQGAPDLALTQVLVETVTLIAFVLVLRRLPANLGTRHGSGHRILRAVIASAVGALMALVAVIALGVRTAKPISEEFRKTALEIGHGHNIVNVILVDIRGWDTMGEISVLVVAATGIASLIFIRQRTGRAPRLDHDFGLASIRSRVRPLTEPTDSRGRPGTDAADESAQERRAWLLAGWTLEPHRRSIVLEVVVRLVFHSAIVVSVYLLFVGHNAPGGGFAGGLLAGLALATRYLAGGRYELGAAVSLDAGKVLGVGLVLAAGTATLPLFVGDPALNSAWLEATVPVLGHLEVGTTTVFDIGVYLVVIGLVLDMLRSLGAEIDRQRDDPTGTAVTPPRGAPEPAAGPTAEQRGIRPAVSSKEGDRR